MGRLKSLTVWEKIPDETNGSASQISIADALDGNILPTWIQWISGTSGHHYGSLNVLRTGIYYLYSLTIKINHSCIGISTYMDDINL